MQKNELNKETVQAINDIEKNTGLLEYDSLAKLLEDSDNFKTAPSNCYSESNTVPKS